MLIFVLIIGLFFLAVAVTMVMRAVGDSGRALLRDARADRRVRLRRSAPARVAPSNQVGFKERMDSLSGAIGRWAASRFTRFKLPDYRARLVSAGMYDASPERLLGMQFLTAVAFTFGWLALGASATWPPGSTSSGPSPPAIFGWIAPVFVVDRKARKRREQIEKDLPDLIDLVVVTLEAGLSFPQSLRLASTKIKEPLAGEVRLTLQEQNMGLTLVEALTNFLGRIDTPGVRMFARSIAQGETMGVSTGQIMRNLAVELRKRRRAAAEEQAQKAPVKMLFPIAFLIMPALFIVLLVPMVIIIMDVL